MYRFFLVSTLYITIKVVTTTVCILLYVIIICIYLSPSFVFNDARNYIAGSIQPVSYSMLLLLLGSVYKFKQFNPSSSGKQVHEMNTSRTLLLYSKPGVFRDIRYFGISLLSLFSGQTSILNVINICISDANNNSSSSINTILAMFAICLQWNCQNTKLPILQRNVMLIFKLEHLSSFGKYMQTFASISMSAFSWSMVKIYRQ